MLTQNDTPPRVVAYLRVSTTKQAEEGVSLEVQEERLRGYVQSRGGELVAVCVDAGVSGSVPVDKRPGLDNALKMIERGEADTLAAVKLDRFGRKLEIHLSLMRAAQRGGWNLVSLAESLDTSSATGRMVVSILGAVAECEREQTRERVKVAVDKIAKTGRSRSYRTPFGYRTPDGEPAIRKGDRRPLVAYPPELQQLQQMIDLVLQKAWGYRRVHQELEARGEVSARSGRPWTVGAVRKVLKTAERRGRLGVPVAAEPKRESLWAAHLGAVNGNRGQS